MTKTILITKASKKLDEEKLLEQALASEELTLDELLENAYTDEHDRTASSGDNRDSTKSTGV